MAGLNRNDRQVSSGMGGRFEPEYALSETRIKTGQPDKNIPWDVSKIFTLVKIKASMIFILLNKKDKIIFTNILDNIRKNIVSCCSDAKKYPFEVEDYINKLKYLLATTIGNVKL